METKGLGFYLPFHKYGPHLGLSLSGSWRHLLSAWWDAVSKEPRSFKKKKKKRKTGRESTLCMYTRRAGTQVPCCASGP